ncbi:MAG: D-glycero-beta-D-manno-heptose 1-phosphate adenylyltransferase [Oligoflexales bacterium]
MTKTTSSLPWEGATKKILVVGDPILDEYWEGKVTRISPEAPVPVHLVTKTHFTAGGAANVARNVQLVGGQAMLCGVWGKDDSAQTLRDLLNTDKVDFSLTISSATKPTIRKTRVTSNSHHIVRIDWEKIDPIDAAEQNQLFSNITESNFNALLISDYAKGGLTPEFLKNLLTATQARGIPVIIDPKGTNYDKYRGAFLITPNEKEACDALGLDLLETWPKEYLADELKKRYGFKNVIITLGPKGMFGSFEKETHYLEAVKREVFDVSGAGDTVVAMLALALASGCGFKEAMHIANTAAGIVVEKWGTQPILMDELKEALNVTPTAKTGFEAKIMTPDALRRAIGNAQTRRERVVFTNGCFDILHLGHVTYLNQARALGDKLIVALNSDNSVRRLKGDTRPVNKIDDRLKVIAALGFVDYVTFFEEDTPENLIKTLGPNILVKGGDYAKSEIAGGKYVESIGGQVIILDYVPGKSTTELIATMHRQK